MGTINFDQLYQNLESGITTLAKSSLQEYLTAAQTDGQNALAGIKSNLQQWAQAVENGSLSFEDLAFLLKGEDALTEMTALKQAGLAEVRIDSFKNDLVNLISGTVLNFIKL